MRCNDAMVKETALMLLKRFIETGGNASSHRQSREAVLILLYNFMTIPSRYAVTSTANPQATEDAERQQY